MGMILQTIVTVAATTTSVQAVPVNQNRKYLAIRNRGADTIVIKPDAIHSSTEGISIASGASMEFKDAPLNAIWVRAVATTATVDFIEGL